MKCEFYKTETRVFKSNEIPQQPDNFVTCHWCRAPNSPATSDNVWGTVGGAARLICGGDLAKCQIT